MSNQKRLDSIEELKSAHNEFLNATMKYDAPAERKVISEESMKEFAKLMEKIEKGETSDEQILDAIKNMKSSAEARYYPKGACSIDCIRDMIRAQQKTLVVATKSGLPNEVVAGIGELCNTMLTDTTAMMLSLANSEDRPWEIREKVHTMLDLTTTSIMKICDSIAAGRILALKLPKLDNAAVKQFMN